MLCDENEFVKNIWGRGEGEWVTWWNKGLMFREPNQELYIVSIFYSLWIVEWFSLVYGYSGMFDLTMLKPLISLCELFYFCIIKLILFASKLLLVQHIICGVLELCWKCKSYSPTYRRHKLLHSKDFMASLILCMYSKPTGEWTLE